MANSSIMTIMHSEAEWGEVTADVIHWDPAVVQNLEKHGILPGV